MDSNWPGEREPSYRDVEAASQVPEAAWLSDFRACLMASEDALGVQDLMHLDLKVRRSPADLQTDLGSPKTFRQAGRADTRTH